MGYRIGDLMSFELVPRGQAIVCTLCGAVVLQLVDGPEDLDDILAPCVEHRRDCPEPDSRSVAGGTT
jgi:hypothetical protein